VRVRCTANHCITAQLRLPRYAHDDLRLYSLLGIHDLTEALKGDTATVSVNDRERQVRAVVRWIVEDHRPFAIRDRLVFSLTYRGIVHTRGTHVVLASLLDARYRNSAFDLASAWLFPIGVQQNAIADLRRMERELGGAAAHAFVPAAPPVQKEEEDRSRLRLLQPPALAAPIPAAAAAAAVTEVDRYLQLPFSADSKDKDSRWAVDWWRQNESNFPILTRIAKRYLAIPTSSAEPERVWSAAKLICSDLRGKLLSKTFIDHLLIHRNKDLLIDSD